MPMLVFFTELSTMLKICIAIIGNCVK